jgi:hypothetical protein
MFEIPPPPEYEKGGFWNAICLSRSIYISTKLWKLQSWKFIFISHHESGGLNHDVKVANETLENLTKVKLSL